MRKHFRLQVVLGLLVIMLMALFGGAHVGASDASGEVKTYVVMYKSQGSPAGVEAAMRAAGGELVYDYAQIGVVIARSANPDFAAVLERDSRVEGVGATNAYGVQLDEGEVQVLDETQVAAVGATEAWGDPWSDIQWDMNQIHVPEAHAITAGSRDVVVGIIDSGIDYTHEDLQGQINVAKSVSCQSGAPNQDPAAWMDRRGHGTHVAGTVAAAQNGIGIVGVAPGVQLAAIKSSTDAGYYYPEMVICSFMWAAEQQIDVTNNSYYVDPWWMNCRNDAEQRIVWKAVQRAVRYAMNQGVAVVAAAGNGNYDLTHPTVDPGSPNDSIPITREVTNACLVIPNEIPGVISVSAVGYEGLRAVYSDYGMGAIQVAAPGGDWYQLPPDVPTGGILSTYTRNRYVFLYGTSMAAPHVTGVAALVVSQYGKMPPGKLQAILTSSADPMSCPAAPTTCAGSGGGYTSYFGHGLVNAYKAVTHSTN